MARAALLLATVLLAGCAAPEPSESTTPPTDDGDADGATLAWREHPFLGSILVDGQGRSLYVFLDDRDGRSTCEGGCAAAWPPLLSRGDLEAPAGLQARLTTVTRPDGQPQVALDNRPLYLYAKDSAPGDAAGQGRGGAWFVVRQTDRPGQLNVDFLDGPGEHEVRAENATYAAGVNGYLARPVGVEDAPGIVMIHEWWGLNDHMRTMAQALASHGYAVLAVDLFGGEVATTPEDAQQQVQGLDKEGAVANLRDAAAYLREEAGATRVASLGWCFGGDQSLALALSGEPLVATVLYYGRPVNDTEALGAIEWPVLGVFGAEDRFIPVAAVRAFESAMNETAIEHEIHVYEGVGHAFANPSGDAYAAPQAMDAWAKTLAFLDEHVKR